MAEKQGEQQSWLSRTFGFRSGTTNRGRANPQADPELGQGNGGPTALPPGHNTATPVHSQQGRQNRVTPVTNPPGQVTAAPVQSGRGRVAPVTNPPGHVISVHSQQNGQNRAASTTNAAGHVTVTSVHSQQSGRGRGGSIGNHPGQTTAVHSQQKGQRNQRTASLPATTQKDRQHTETTGASPPARLLYFDKNEKGKPFALGEGSSGIVFRGKYDEEDCAIKVFGEDVKQEASKELEATKKLNRHPNVVHVLGLVPHPEIRSKHCLVMEMCGMNLETLIQKRSKGLKPKSDWIALLKKIEILLGVAQGVIYLHSQNIVHRDLSSSNILLSARIPPEDEVWTDCVKITDFGLARRIDPQKRQKDTASHGNRDILPEDAISQLKGKQVFSLTEKVDVFSYGCLILEICCGEFPKPENVRATPAEMQDMQFRAFLEIRRRMKFMKELPPAEKDVFDESIRACLKSKELRCTFAEIQYNLVQCQQKYSGGKEDIAQLQSTVAKLESTKAELTSAREEIEKQSQRAEELEQRKTNLEEDCQQLDEDLKEVEEKLIEKEQEVLELRSSADQLTRDRNEWKVKYEEHKKASEAYQNTMGSINVTGLWKQCSDATEKCKELEDERNRMQKKISDLDAALAAESQRAEALTKDKAAMQSRIDSQKDELREKTKTGELLDEEVLRLKKFEEANPKLRSTIAQKTEELTRIEEKRRDMTTSLQSATEKLRKQGEELAEEKKRAVTAEEQLRKLKWTCTDAERDRDAKGKSLSREQKIVRQLEQDLNQKTIEHAALEKKCQGHLVTISHLTEDYEKLQSSSFSLETKYKTETVEKDTAQSSLTTCQAQLKEATATNSSLQKCNSQLQLEKERLESEVARLESETKKLTEENASLSKDCEAAEIVRDRTLRDYNGSQRKIEELELKLKDQTDEYVPQLEEDNRTMKEQLVATKNELREAMEAQRLSEERAQYFQGKMDAAEQELRQQAEELHNEKVKSEQLKTDLENEKQGKERLKELTDELSTSYKSVETGRDENEKALAQCREECKSLLEKLNNAVKQRQSEADRLQVLTAEKMRLEEVVELLKTSWREAENTALQCQRDRKQVLDENSELQRSLEMMKDKYTEAHDQALKEACVSAKRKDHCEALEQEKSDLQMQNNELAVKAATNFEYEKRIGELEKKLVSSQCELERMHTHERERHIWVTGEEDNRKLQEKLKAEEYALEARSKLLDEREVRLEAWKEIVELVKSGQQVAVQDALDKMFKVPLPHPAMECERGATEPQGSDDGTGGFVDIQLVQAVQHVNQLLRDNAVLKEELNKLTTDIGDAADVWQRMETEIMQLKEQVLQLTTERDQSIQSIRLVRDWDLQRVEAIRRAIPTVQQVTAFMSQFRYCDLDFFSDNYQYPFENIQRWCKDIGDHRREIEMFEVETLSQINAVKDISDDLKWISSELSNVLKDLDRRLVKEPHGNVIIPLIGYARNRVFAVLRFCALPWLTEERPKYIYIGACVTLTRECCNDGQLAKEGPNGIIYQPEFIVNGESQDLHDLPVPCKRQKLPRELAMMKKWLDSLMVRKLKETATKCLQTALHSGRDD